MSLTPLILAVILIAAARRNTPPNTIPPDTP